MVTYADKPWLKHYDEGVPASLEPYSEITIPDFLRRSAEKFPKRPALVMDAKLPYIGRVKRSVSYRQLDRLSDAMAVALINLGLHKGDHVALVMPNCTAFVIAYYGVLKAGGVVVAVNPEYPPLKMQKQLKECDAVMMVTLSLYYKTIKEIQPETKLRNIIVTNIKEYLPRIARILFTMTTEKRDGHAIEKLPPGDYRLQDLLKRYRGKKPDVEVKPSDVALMQYTGGTTGTPKAAMAAHSALVASTLQANVWSTLDLPEVENMPARHELVFLGVIPMFHVYGLVVLLSQAISGGASVIMVPNPRDMNNLVEMIDHYKPTVFLGVPTLWNALTDNPDVKSGKVSLESIIIAYCAAAPMHRLTREAAEAAGVRKLVQAYGLSEVPAGNHSNPMIGENRLDSVGLPLPDVDSRIVDLETGTKEMPVGQPGEIIVHSPSLMMGYYNQPEETQQVLREFDGKLFMYTGDVGYMDEDGYFYITDRKKDMVLIGGFNVYPAIVEKVLLEHPAVQDVGVAGIPHPKKAGEEALMAWVVVKPGHQVKRGDLIAHCKPYLAGYEIPRRYEFVDHLPKSAVGKLLRRELVQML
ncbi:MAG: hypothetical protein D6711_14845 [Chloroflexi bacterium]|nr:MAG: hypothetical protein D6711_14845 [Chloroflexota bacterium]